VPGEMYRLSLRDFNAAKYDLAAVGFRQYIEKFPQGPQTPSAQLYLGEIQMVKGAAEGAAAEYQKVFKNYPKSSEAPTAIYKLALAYRTLGKKEKAVKALNALISGYPESPDIPKAKELITSLTSAR